MRTEAPATKERLLLTMNETAAWLGVSPRFLQGLVYNGDLPSVVIGRRVRRILVSEVERYVLDAAEMQKVVSRNPTTSSEPKTAEVTVSRGKFGRRSSRS